MYRKLLKTVLSGLAITVTGLAIAAAVFSNDLSETRQPVSAEELKVDNEHAAFHTMMKVLTHQRCVNCHPSNDQPKQGDDSHPHLFGVERGPDNHGVAALKCNSCHQDENNNFSGVPGAPEWSLAPLSMAWEGLSAVEIAKSMVDRTKNGDRSIEEIEHHLTEHALVLWAWTPGVNADGEAREVPPVPVDEYIAAVKKWVADGAIIPED